MAKWFYKQNILCVRWSAWPSRPTLPTLICAILTIPFGIIFGWVDLVWLLLFRHLLFAKA